MSAGATQTGSKALHHIIVVGGGAGGLELVSKLGDKLGRKKKAKITLVDRNLTHLWKPLLHEVAAGSLNSYEDEVGYLGQSRWRHYHFRLGAVDRLDREKREISLAPSVDGQGREYIPRRSFHYDTLVFAVGSVSNDFGIPGVREHCMFLDSRSDADKFHQSLLRSFFAAQAQTTPLRKGQLNIAIAGAGATGVELCAELHNASRRLTEFGLDQIRPDTDVKIFLVEASKQILPALPPEMAARIGNFLRKIDIEVLTDTRITEASADGFTADHGRFIPAEIKVWAAGIKAPDCLKTLDGLETNHLNQLVVRPTLQTTVDENIFAFGDCAACPLAGDAESVSGGNTVPPRAQAAHQQAALLAKSLRVRVQGKHLRGETELPHYRYTDFGSLVNMSKYKTIGNLMGSFAKISGSALIEGVVARLLYISLYKMHLVVLHGFIRTMLTSVANFLTRRTKPRIKLH